jgi:hypothetical protein
MKKYLVIMKKMNIKYMNKMLTKKEEKKVFFPLTYSPDNKQMLWQQYIDHLDEFENEKMVEVINYLLKLDDFEKTLWLIQCEYNNYRLTTEETNISLTATFKIIKKIREDLKTILINK